VQGGQDAAQVVQSEIMKITSEANVRMIQQKSLIEVRDMDILTTKEDLAQGLELNSNDIRVINIRSSFGGTQTGIVLIPKQTMTKITKRSRIRVGVVYCRVRECKGNIRCYRCLGQGHEVRNCSGSNRKGKCNKCGKEGHFARYCKASREETEEFRAVLAAEAARPRDE